MVLPTLVCAQQRVLSTRGETAGALAGVVCREVAILGHVAPIAIDAVDVKKEEAQAKGGTSKDGEGRLPLEAVDHDHRHEHDLRER